MGELARYRRGRDLHLSRGHLGAALVGVVLLSAISFALGHHLGARERTEPRPALSFSATAPREGLVELLARVETSGDPTGGVDALTFPEALTRSSGGGVADLGPLPGGPVRIEVARSRDVADARRLRALLRDASIEAAITAELEAGVMSWRVLVGGFPDEDAARDGLAALQQALAGWDGEPIAPVILAD